MYIRLMFTAAAGAAAIGLLIGCSGASQSVAPSLPLSSAHFAGPAQILSRLTTVSPAKVEHDFFVSDDGPNVFEISNKTYKNVGDITSGVDASIGLWADKKGNVYVGNVSGDNVTEYKKGKGSPVCTYSSGIIDPVNITTDAAGNVYIADFNRGYPGYIDVFPQCSNTMSKQYDVSNGPSGVAVDKSGNIFVVYRDPSTGEGKFEEFKSGSSSPTPLGAMVSSSGGLILDKNRNLIAVDQTCCLDVIAPPYSSAKTLVSVNGPKDVALNQKENLLFSSNNGAQTITIYKYPSGSLVKTIDASTVGIDYVEGIAESPNAVF